MPRRCASGAKANVFTKISSLVWFFGLSLPAAGPQPCGCAAFLPTRGRFCRQHLVGGRLIRVGGDSDSPRLSGNKRGAPLRGLGLGHLIIQPERRLLFFLRTWPGPHSSDDQAPLLGRPLPEVVLSGIGAWCRAVSSLWVEPSAHGTGLGLGRPWRACHPQGGGPKSDLSGACL